MDEKEKLEFDKLPGTVETSAFRKTSDDFTFTIATPRKHEEYAKKLMSRLGGFGVFFFVPCQPDQADGLLKNNDNGEVQGIGTGDPVQKVIDGGSVSVETMAAILGMTPRNVQLQSEKGLLIRAGRGQYDTLATCGALWRALKEAETGKNDTYNDERTAAMRLKRLERERLHEEAMRRLVSYEALIPSWRNFFATIKQKILFWEKSMPPRTQLLPANEQEVIYHNESQKLLAELATIEISGIADLGSTADIHASSGPHREPVGGRKKKARKQDKR